MSAGSYLTEKYFVRGKASNTNNLNLYGKEEKMKKFLSILILVVFAATIAVLVYSVAFGQDTMLETVIIDDKIVVYKITKIEKEIIPLPNAELSISEGNAKKVCETETRKITITEEINKKINFWTFPITKTKLLAKKNISYNRREGWHSQSVNQTSISEKEWGLTVAVVCLFFYFILLSYTTWKNKKSSFVFIPRKNKKSKVIALLAFYLCLFLACLLTAANILTSNPAAEWASSILAILFGASALISIITAQKGFFDPTPPTLWVVFNGIIFIIINMVLAGISAKYNSTAEFMTILVEMMSVSFYIGWLIYLGKKKNISKEISGVGIKTKP